MSARAFRMSPLALRGRAYTGVRPRDRNLIRLDMNEVDPALWPPVKLPSDPSRYPDYAGLTRRAADWLEVSADMVLATAGASEGLLAASLAFVCPGSTRALVSRPTFSLIPGYLRMAGAELVEVPVLEDLSHDLRGLEGALSQGVEVAVLATPDNPTGMVVPAEELLGWIRRFPRTLFVVDEAYGELAGPTIAPLTRDLPNLLVLKSFSKVWGLAGLRLGLAAGKPRLLEAMRRVRTPFAAGSAAVQAGLQRVDSADLLPKVVEAIRRRRKLLAHVLSELGLFVPGGCSANFLPVRVGKAATMVAASLRERGILVRQLPGAMPGWLRITAGSIEETEALARELKGVLYEAEREV